MEKVYYVWRQAVNISWDYADAVIASMKEKWIIWLAPIFDNEEDTKEFCWNKYLLMVKEK